MRLPENVLIKAAWPAPSHIHAFTTTRESLIQLPTQDRQDEAANEIRLQFKNAFDLPAEPFWLQQKHGAIVKNATQTPEFPEADASYTSEKNTVCVVLTADCLPLLLCDEHGNEVAAVHCGWRGIASPLIENTIEYFQSPREKILAWMGPAIGPNVFEVGPEVLDIFLEKNKIYDAAFTTFRDRFLANIYELTRLTLHELGITQIHGGGLCTYSDSERFYSYRRDGKNTGRMASVIYSGD